MASNIATVGTLGTILFISIFFIAAFNYMGQEIYSKQSNTLDTTSKNIIGNLNYGATYTYTNATLTASSSGFAENSTFVNVDPFSRQYLEDKADSNTNQGIISQIVNLPRFLYELTGLPTSPIFLSLVGILAVYIGYLIGLAVYKFLKGEVD